MEAESGEAMSQLPEKPRRIWLRSFYGFNPEDAGYIGWTEEGPRDRMLGLIEDGDLPWIGEVGAPSLVLTGENDGGCPPRLNELIAKAMPKAEFVVLPGLRHAILLEAAEKVAKPMLAFLAKV